MTQRLVDYKFFCFDGRVEFMFIAQGRGKDLRFDFFDRYFRPLDVENGVKKADKLPEKPNNYDYMICIVEKLAKNINNVRVDLYNISGKIYFSEMTFYHNGGMVCFEPYWMDKMLGEYFIKKNI